MPHGEPECETMEVTGGPAGEEGEPVEMDRLDPADLPAPEAPPE